MTYTEFLTGLRLRHFAPSEITSYANRTRGGVRNSLPPEELWENLVPTLWLVDQLRHAINSPITLISIYRDHDYNAAVGGAPQSLHMKNNAIDFTCAHVGKAEDLLRDWRDAGVFMGGLHYYPDSNFCHVDTRGSNSDWG